MGIIARMKNRLVYGLVKKTVQYGEEKGLLYSSGITYNLNLDLTKNQKKILVCYINYNEASNSLKNGVTHTNQPRLFQILKVLYELEMVVDICACNDIHAANQLDFEKYDYILGFGKVFDRACEANVRAKKIIYMTEDPYDVAKVREDERIEYFMERHDAKSLERQLKSFKNTRAGFFYPQGQEKKADFIITQGHEGHYCGLDAKVYSIVPNAFKNSKFENVLDKKVEKTFVMFGASSLVRKGTDILVDVFSKHSEWQLYLCDKGITANLNKLGYAELPSNIHDCGFIDIESEELVELFQKTRFIILPSCTEAPSSAVLTGMRHGLIPIVTKGIGLDKFFDFCLYFEDYHLDEIEMVIEDVCKISTEDLNERSKKIYTYANENFTIESFTLSMKTILEDIVKNDQ